MAKYYKDVLSTRTSALGDAKVRDHVKSWTVAAGQITNDNDNVLDVVD